MEGRGLLGTPVLGAHLPSQCGLAGMSTETLGAIVCPQSYWSHGAQWTPGPASAFSCLC